MVWRFGGSINGTIAAEVLELSVTERVQIVQDIWDSIAVVPESIALTDGHKDDPAVSGLWC